MSADKKPRIDFETERLHIRTVEESDKTEYMALRVNNSTISVAYSTIPGFEDFEWESELNAEDDIHLSVFKKEDGRFVASASIQNYKKDTIELGYDVAEEYRNHGYATELIKGLLSEAHGLFPDARFIIRVDKDNPASKRVAEKCGGVLAKNEDSFARRWFANMKEDFAEKGLDFEENERYEDIRSVMEEGKESVCVYELP